MSCGHFSFFCSIEGSPCKSIISTLEEHESPFSFEEAPFLISDSVTD